MPRPIILVALAYIAVCAGAIVGTRLQQPAFTAVEHGAPFMAEAPIDDAGTWFQTVKPFCNPVEVELAVRRHQPPAGESGTAYLAACLALAGRVADARQAIGALPSEARWRAAGIVFEIAHPVADAGDDRAAGPIMAMVADFWPNHYMALYHAGMSEYATGDVAAARKHLEAFLEHYPSADGWRSNARLILDRIGQ